MRSSGGGRDPLDRWPEFGAVVRKRLERGAAEYGDSALTRPMSELTGEIAEELEDLAAWSFLLWLRVQGLEKAVNADGDSVKATQTPKLLNAQEVAERLSLPKARVYALAREGRISGVLRLGSQIRFDSQALEAWIRRGGAALGSGSCSSAGDGVPAARGYRLPSKRWRAQLENVWPASSAAL